MSKAARAQGAQGVCGGLQGSGGTVVSGMAGHSIGRSSWQGQEDQLWWGRVGPDPACARLLQAPLQEDTLSHPEETA